MDWNEDFTELTFTPSSLYPRFARLTAALPASTLARGGSELGEDFQASFSTVPALGVLPSEPRQGGIHPVYRGLTLHFTSQLPSEDVLEYITLTPRVPNLTSYLMEDRVLMLYGDFSPDTSYQLVISEQLEDYWGGKLEAPYTLEFTTSPLEPELNVPMDVLFLTPEDNSLSAQATNISICAGEPGKRACGRFPGNAQSKWL
jgi:hypothetical protein